MKTFAEVMVARMGELGMRATALSDRSGVSRQYISQLVTGKLVDPAWLKACAIIDALELTREEFAALQMSD